MKNNTLNNADSCIQILHGIKLMPCTELACNKNRKRHEAQKPIVKHCVMRAICRIERFVVRGDSHGILRVTAKTPE